MRGQVEVLSLVQDSARAQLLREQGRQRREILDSLGSISRELLDLRGAVVLSQQGTSDELARLAELMGEAQLALTRLQEEFESARARPPPVSEDAEPASDASAPSEDVEAGSETPEEVYEAIMSQVSRGNYETARFGLEDFIQSFPGDTLAPSAYLQLGIVLMRLEEYEAALERLSAVRSSYSGHAAVPESMFRAAEAHIELGEEEAARQLLELLVRSYDEHLISDEARRLLQEIS